MADVFSDKELVKALSLASRVSFSFLELGKNCNGNGSAPFTSAVCDLKPINDPKNSTPGCTRPYITDLYYLFRPGFDMIMDLLKGRRKYEDLDEHYKKAFEVLKKYRDQERNHSESLQKILGISDKISETTLTTAYAEHLLGKLAPGKSYVIDKKCRDKPLFCKCGCNATINYGDTGIGHESVWHGFLDIVFSSHEGVKELGSDETAVVAEPDMKRCKQEADDSDGSDEFSYDEPLLSPGGKCSAEVKVVFTDSSIESQSVAQAIVFSTIQMDRHEDFENHIVPTIVISKQEVRVILYDAENDILLRSRKMGIYGTFSDTQLELSEYCIIVLWVVLHYRIFGSCIQKDELKLNDLTKIRSGFVERVREHIEVYRKKYRYLIGSFPRVDLNQVVDDDIIDFHGSYLPQDRFYNVIPMNVEDNI